MDSIHIYDFHDGHAVTRRYYGKSRIAKCTCGGRESTMGRGTRPTCKHTIGLGNYSGRDQYVKRETA